MTKLPFFPQTVFGTQKPVQFIHVKASEPEERIRRSAFLQLANKATDNPREHIYVEYDVGLAYYIDEPSDGMRRENVRTCLEFDKERKRYERSHRCPLINTKKCDGWIRDEETGERRCDRCQHHDYIPELSTDEDIVDDDGESDSFGSMLPSADPTPEEAMVSKFEREQLAELLAALPEKDRQLVIAAHEQNADFGDVARRFGLGTRNYANKKAHRIEERLRKAARKMDE